MPTAPRESPHPENRGEEYAAEHCYPYVEVELLVLFSVLDLSRLLWPYCGPTNSCV